MQLWIWRHLRLDVPDDWEMLQFSRDPAKGRLAFADRTHYRLELTWQTVPGPPDFGRMMSDYVARLTLNDVMPDAKAIESLGWPGIAGRQDGLLTRRFGRHLPEEKLLIEVVLLWPGEWDAELETSILDSIAVDPPGEGGFRRWRAFGMDLLAAKGLELNDCRVEPANVRLGFESRKRGMQETYERLGMVDEWLKGTVGDWLHHQARKDVTVEMTDSTSLHGHAVVTLAGTRGSSGVQSLFMRPARYQAAAWRCPADGRLYRVTTTGEPEHSLAGARLRCCEKW